jgi:hypothetical protein
MTRPDLPVAAAWPTADHSVGASVFESGLAGALEGWEGELWESVRRISKQSWNKHGIGPTSQAVGGRGSIFKKAVELVHVQLSVHMWKIDLRRFCRDCKIGVSDAVEARV